MTAVMTAIQNWIMSLNGGSKFLVGAVIGACMGFDMGGPINKTASMAANALFADGYAAPESAKIIGGMTPPIGVAIATFLQPKKFTQAERDTVFLVYSWDFPSLQKVYSHLRKRSITFYSLLNGR